MIEPAEDFEGAVFVYPGYVFGGDEGAGVHVGEVDNIECACAGGGDIERIIDIADEYLHSGGGAEDAISKCIGLGQQFRHPIFGVDMR